MATDDRSPEEARHRRRRTQDAVPWTCPSCRAPLALGADGRTWACPAGHSFDVARPGYVNLLLSHQRRSRAPGDSLEMVAARGRFLASGAYQPVAAAVAAAVGSLAPTSVLDVGCGEGYYLRALDRTRPGVPPALLGFDVAKPAVAAAARAHPGGSYAVASAGDIPLGDAAVALALSVFGPVVATELARVVAPGGHAVTAHPGPGHLRQLRALVYDAAAPHVEKPPLRHEHATFAPCGRSEVAYTLPACGAAQLIDLFTMTPYRWHAGTDVEGRLRAAADEGIDIDVDVVITAYERIDPAGRFVAGGPGPATM